MKSHAETMAETIFNESLGSLMAHTIRGVTNYFGKKFIELDLRVIADTSGRVRLRGPNKGATSVLVTRLVRRKNELERDRVYASIYIHNDANKHLARICIAHEIYHLLLELDAYLKCNRKKWACIPSDKGVEDACNVFAWRLCKFHDGFNKNPEHVKNHVHFPEHIFDKPLKTNDTAWYLEWPEGILLDPKNPFHGRPKV